MKVRRRPLRPQVCRFAYASNRVAELTGYLGTTVLGHVTYAQWPNSALATDDRVDPISTTSSRGEDWALVGFGPRGHFTGVGITCNTFYVPGAPERQKVTGYVRTADLCSGQVWVCAGVSGVQSGFLKQHPASIFMSKSLFAVRSISLEQPLGMSLLIKLRRLSSLIALPGYSRR